MLSSFPEDCRCGGMRIEGLPTHDLIIQPGPAALRAWMVGQLLIATVIGRAGENSMRLAINGETLDAAGPAPLAIGTRLALRVASVGPTPVLTMMTAGSELADRHAITKAVNGALPQHAALGPLVTHLAAAAAAAATKASGTPARLAAPLQRLDSQLPTLADLADPGRLAERIANSGLMLEATLKREVLAGSSTPPAEDFKWQALALRERALDHLTQQAPNQKPVGPGPGPGSAGAPPAAQFDLRLAPSGRVSAPASPQADVRLPPAERWPAPSLPSAPAALPSTAIEPGELAAKVDAIIASITTQQLQSAAAALEGTVHALCEIPIRTGVETEVLRLQVDRDGKGEADSTVPPFTVAIEVPMGNHGELRATLTLRGEQIAVSLWSDDGELRRLLAQDKDVLADGLRRAGLVVERLRLIDVPAIDPLARVPARLVDTRV